MKHLFPGATVGILGGGQLARMTALEAKRMGYRVRVSDPDPNGSAAQVADACVQGAFDDAEAATTLAKQCDVVTLDTEHIPAELLRTLEAVTPVYPGADVLAVVQDRGTQRAFLRRVGAPQPRNALVTDPASLAAAGEVTGFPAVLKTTRAGYDGKGQARVERAEDLARAWDSLGKQPAVLEEFVSFEREVSVLLARDLTGNFVFYPLAENLHRHHILHTTRVPARVSSALVSQAQALGSLIARELGHVGMLAIELFVTHDDRLLVNELAPRTHNSGHYTFGACVTSQFEQHVRAICGLPLGDTSLLRPVVMLNLLGDLWQQGEPDWNIVLQHPEAQLHLYGKTPASVGRKMGHVLFLHEDIDHAMTLAERVHEQLSART